MSNTTLVACSLGYTPRQTLNWVYSARTSGFQGDLVLLVDNSHCDYTFHKSYDCYIVQVDRSLARKSLPPYWHKKMIKIAPHVERFYHLILFIQTIQSEYVISTDARDVVFQEDPSLCLQEIVPNNLVFASEGLVYKNERWGLKNIRSCFNDIDYSYLVNKEIFNVGVLAGKTSYLLSLMRHIYSFSLARPISIVDQAIFNFIIHSPLYYANSSYMSTGSKWACNLGTSLDPSLPSNKFESLLEPAPTFKNGFYLNSQGDKYSIVHQYDRCPQYLPLFSALCDIA